MNKLLLNGRGLSVELEITIARRRSCPQGSPSYSVGLPLVGTPRHGDKRPALHEPLLTSGDENAWTASNNWSPLVGVGVVAAPIEARRGLNNLNDHPVSTSRA